MATRLGIELSAEACRLVEMDGRMRADAPDAAPRVRSFAVLPPAGPDTDSMLASLKGRAAAVIVWGAAAELRQVVVAKGSYESMRREAVASLAGLGVETHAALADIAPVHNADGHRQAIVAALAAAEPMLDAIRPLRAAGIRIRSLGTPAMALAAMASMRRGTAAQAAVEAYVAIEETSTCIALMRDGALAVAHELPWGYIDTGALRPQQDIAARLATELQKYFEAVGAPAAAQVCICGGAPDLRTMCAILTEQLDLEVEPLDSLFGIDPERLPEPSTEFRDRVAELRVAWAAAADWPPHLNLLRARRRQQSRRALAAAAIVAGVVAGVGGAWRLAHSDVWPAFAPPQQAAATPKPVPPPATARQVPPSPAATSRPVPPPPTVTSRPVAPPSSAPPPRPLLAARSIVPRTAPSVALMRPPQPTLTPTLVASLRSPVATAPATIATAPPAVIARQPVAPPPPVLRKPTPPVERPAPRITPPPVIARQQPPPSSQRPAQPIPAPAQTRETAARASKPEPILPFDASLETILYSSERRFAIIDGRIVGVGDLVRGARIVEISPTAVMLRDGEGRLRRLALGPAAIK